jgi:hypothetical protein
MDVETPARGKTDHMNAHRERKTFHQGQPGRPGPRGLFPFHHDVGLGRHMTSPRSPMTSPNVLGVLEAVVCQVAHVTGSCGTRRPNVLLQEANVAQKGPNATLKGHDVTFTTCFRV